MLREFNVVIEQDEEGYFVASVPALRGCHTQAKSLDVLMKRIKEAITLCLEVDDAPVSNLVGGGFVSGSLRPVVSNGCIVSPLW